MQPNLQRGERIQRTNAKREDAFNYYGMSFGLADQFATPAKQLPVQHHTNIRPSVAFARNRSWLYSFGLVSTFRY